MAGVVHELVDVGVRAEHRHRALVVADEVVRDQREQSQQGQAGRHFQSCCDSTQIHAGDVEGGVGIHREVLTVLVVVIVVMGVGMAACVGQHRGGQQLVAVDERVERRDPVVVVLPLPPFGFGLVLPLTDPRDQAFLKLAPGVVPELGQREG